jgi:hypothetical protein
MERKSPKFYVADGIVLRMREAAAHVIDDVLHDGAIQDRAVDAIRRQTFDTLDTLYYSDVITEDEALELKLKLSKLLNEDDEKRHKERTSK